MRFPPFCWFTHLLRLPCSKRVARAQRCAMSDAWRSRVKAGEPVPPPPAALVSWANATVAATLAGSLYGAALAHVGRETGADGTHPQARRARTPSGSSREEKELSRDAFVLRSWCCSATWCG